MKIKLLLICLFTISNIFPVNYKIIESNDQFIKIEFDFTNSFKLHDTVISNKVFTLIRGGEIGALVPGTPWLPYFTYNFGVPNNSSPTFEIIDIKKEIINNKFIIPFPKDDPDLKKFNTDYMEKDIYSQNLIYPKIPAELSKNFRMRYAVLTSLKIIPYQFNPVKREVVFNKKIIIKLSYNLKPQRDLLVAAIEDKSTEKFLNSTVLNKSIALKWIGKPSKLNIQNSTSTQYWYNPGKNYYKIYLKDKGVYRITYDQLVAAGVPITNGVPLNKLALYNNGVIVPIDIKDNGDSVFNSGDYFQFVGYPPKPSPYSKLNIYNTENVYWFTYENEDSTAFYRNKDGYPQNWTSTIQRTIQTLHYERDTIYERLGYAPDGKRDHWFWGKAIGAGGVIQQFFTQSFPSFDKWYVDSNTVKLRVNLHGITDNAQHKVEVMLTSQLVDSITWYDQTEATLETSFSVPTINIFPTNNLQVLTRGDVPTGNDEVRINWFEFDYWRINKADENNFVFTSNPDMLGLNVFSIENWMRNNITIYIPQTSEMIKNARYLNNEWNEILFKDSLTEQREYFSVADDYFFSVDSIRKDKSSDLRNLNNGADYIIIYHENFLNAATLLGQYREINLAGFQNPRVKLVDVNDVYDEFSYGLQDPYALREFAKYTFQNWQSPAPQYICLMGDMSWDYRHILPDSRPNFIASIPHQQETYGEAVSDNDIVAIIDSSYIPQMSIGRLSCETPEEASILVNKIINYPGDVGKDWRRNELLIGAGQSAIDEATFQFNSANLFLENNYIKPYGYTTSKVFLYPDTPDQQIYQGAGPEIRQQINNGCVLVNFYGHGGGYQWDLVFLNDDIYALQNENRLPMIMSVTCYTAHFDNQDVFGEQFDKVSGKGSIGFWGNTGLTFWSIGTQINDVVNEEIYVNSDFVIGDAIRNAKSQFGGDTEQAITDHISLLTLLGDPALELALPRKPDFRISNSDITLNPPIPLTNNPVYIKVNLENVGRIFSNDSVAVSVKAIYQDTSFSLGTFYRNGFAVKDSLLIPWTPKLDGNVRIDVVINGDNHIDENDHSDNMGSQNFYIFSLKEPSIIKPYDGFSTNLNKVKILIGDVGYYINQKLVYDIQIDTSFSFLHPIIEDSLIYPNNGLVNWQSPTLLKGEYFWRARMNYNNNFSSWTTIRTISFEDTLHEGYYGEGREFNAFNLENIIYKDSLKGVILNTLYLPPRPFNNKLLDTFNIALPQDLTGLTSITTDGKYIYTASMAYYQPNHLSKIYRIGSGNSGTIKGFNYGEIPGVEVPIWHTMFYHSDGYIYVATGDHNTLLKIQPESGDTSRINIPGGLLNAASQVADGSFYLTSDGVYVYDLAYHDSTEQNFKYIVRKFDPANGWAQIGLDDTLNGSAYENFVGFFVAYGYLYPYENYNDGFMRRINLQTNVFEEEWYTYSPFQYFYSWTFDWTDNEIFTSVFGDDKVPMIFKFIGRYKQSTGTVITPQIGPSSKWNNLTYTTKIQNSSSPLTASLYGLNVITNNWDTLITNLNPNTSLSNYKSQVYPYMKVQFSFQDTTFNNLSPNILKDINLDYLSDAEIYLDKTTFSFNPDTLLQGFTTTFSLGVHNIGYVSADSVAVSFYLDNSDSSFFKTKMTNISVDSSKFTTYTIQTSLLSPATVHSVNAQVSLNKPELYQFNNSLNQTFYVSRDSVNPTFNITFDGKEIINGDIISAKPVVLITMKDNSPLPIDTTDFTTLTFDNVQLSFTDPNLKFSYTPYPNSVATIKWTPTIPDGEHVLEVLAKDPSGNFFDSVSHKYQFYVYNQPDLTNVFNYPDPFKSDTYFTFEIHGQNAPQELTIKIFTVAGRLIRNISVPPSDLQVGFNKIFWNGRDQDGDVVANGVYFYKIIAKNNGVVKTTIEKLAKIK